MNDRKPWERLPEETDRAWAAFQVYRNLLPSGRSYDAAYRKTYDKPPTRHAPKWYRAWAKEHNWRERVQAWDRHLDDIERAAVEEERIEWRKKRRDMLKLFWSTVAKAIDGFDPSGASMGQLTQAVEAVVQEMRAEMDDLPTERRDVTSGGEPLPAAQVTIFIPDNERDQGPSEAG